mmetsp:Transcript_81648/g.218437  ORF Transcript_81648/g.218437 Transcript_81648/m.218437 type:complete len:221 (-) Transcript_81648:1627-2289(-)
MVQPQQRARRPLDLRRGPLPEHQDGEHRVRRGVLRPAPRYHRAAQAQGRQCVHSQVEAGPEARHLRPAGRRRLAAGPPRPRGPHLAPGEGPAARDLRVRHPGQRAGAHGLLRVLPPHAVPAVPVFYGGLQGVGGGEQGECAGVVQQCTAAGQEDLRLRRAAHREVVPPARAQGGPLDLHRGPRPRDQEWEAGVRREQLRGCPCQPRVAGAHGGERVREEH